MLRNETRLNKLFEELVPVTGKADSMAGELVRAVSWIGYRFFNDGDRNAARSRRCLWSGAGDG